MPIKVNAATDASRDGSEGFTLVEVAIVVMLIGLLAAIAIPSFVHSRTEAQKNICINNLKQIDGAIQQWALECRKPEKAAVSFSNITSYLKGSVVCPAGGTTFDDSYTIATVTVVPVCQRVPLTHVLPEAGAIASASGSGSGNGSGGGNANGNGLGNGNGNGLGNGNGNGLGNGNGNGLGNGLGNGQ